MCNLIACVFLLIISGANLSTVHSWYWDIGKTVLIGNNITAAAEVVVPQNDSSVTDPAISQNVSLWDTTAYDSAATELNYWQLVKKRHRGYYRPSIQTITTVADFCARMKAGSYGNPHYECVIYHVCQSDGDIVRYDTLPCPQGLKFNDRVGVCDWPYNVDDQCNAVKKSMVYRRGEAHFVKPLNDTIQLDIRFHEGADINRFSRQSYHMFAEARMRNRIDRVPFYFRQQTRLKQAPTTRQALPYFEIAYPAYLGYKKVRRFGVSP
ncbi:uncharacterized protein LOC129601355 [Paramacrobiotus metropolitanus]|uniref:uncharacterized protein LOC129601355 n=1 Tax=Paramacrobiotus metropolitanus TaxID=2943436 RepID=UPI002445C56F|nr:uncharacterized protein LOC129601355 [Paramacrobiotus metropolitanus]